jgi:hypothetical protein
MTPLRIALFTSILTSTTLSLAADLPRNVLSSNVVVCQPNAGCGHHTFYGLDHKILTTDRFTVMVFLSREGRYTRADVSITNLTPTPASLSPADFRVEALSSRSKIFLYVPPSQLEDISPQTRAIQNAPPDALVPPANPQLNQLEAAQLRATQEAIKFEAATPDLKAIIIPPNQAVSGRVYFERDPMTKHQQVNLVLPIAGTVFKFPYVIEP